MSRSRTVLCLSPMPPPTGGMGTWTRILMKRGLPRGYRPVLVDSAPRGRRGVFRRTSLRHEMVRTVSVLWRYARALRRERPFLVHVNVDPLGYGLYRDGLCALLAHRRGAPMAIHYHGLVARLDDGPPHGLRRRFLRYLCRRADLNLTLNEPSRRFIAQEAAGRSRVELLPNFYDDSDVPETHLERRRPGERLRVIFAGGLTYDKGIAEVVSAAEALPDVDFQVLGHPYPETVEVLAQAPKNFTACGEVAHSEVLRTMASSHVLVFPTRHEGFPIVVCEAMALGLAVVASPVGAIPEMIEDGRGGLLVEPVAHAVTAALAALDADDSRRLAMGRFNQEKCSRLYSYDRVVDQLVSLYEECTRARADGTESAPPQP